MSISDALAAKARNAGSFADRYLLSPAPFELAFSVPILPGHVLA